MTEVLYDPINDELYLFNGMFEVDTKRHEIKIYVIRSTKLGMALKIKDKTVMKVRNYIYTLHYTVVDAVNYIQETTKQNVFI